MRENYQPSDEAFEARALCLQASSYNTEVDHLLNTIIRCSRIMKNNPFEAIKVGQASDRLIVLFKKKGYSLFVCMSFLRLIHEEIESHFSGSDTKGRTDIEIMIHVKCELRELRLKRLLCMASEAMDSDNNPKATAHILRSLAEMDLAQRSISLALAELDKCTIQEH